MAELFGKTYCRECRQKISFIKTTKGKSMPVDEEPYPFVPDTSGKFRFVTQDGEVLRGVFPRDEDRDVHTGYMCHFDVCKENVNNGKKKRNKK